MSDVELIVPFPLDYEGFLRRECPLCRREFKVLLTKEELNALAQERLDSFMIEPEKEDETEESDSGSSDHYCPYCGQSASKDSWWTQEQLEYSKIFAKNIMARIINEHLIRPLERNFGHQSSGLISIKFTGHEMQEEDPWISPETNDMENYDLPCCGRKIKIEPGNLNRVYCYFCGYLHHAENQS
jgi:hypothetical protein